MAPKVPSTTLAADGCVKPENPQPEGLSNLRPLFFSKSYDTMKANRLCMDAPDDRGGITRYRMQEEPEYGNILDEKENYDLQQIVMVYVAHARADMENRLLNLLGELFVSEDDASRKKAELIEHYDIDLNENEERLVSTMCNLSVGVYVRGRESGEQIGFVKGEKSGIRKGKIETSNQIVLNLLQMHMGMDFIKKATGRSEEDIKKLAEENHLPV